MRINLRFFSCSMSCDSTEPFTPSTKHPGIGGLLSMSRVVLLLYQN